MHTTKTIPERLIVAAVQRTWRRRRAAAVRSESRAYLGANTAVSILRRLTISGASKHAPE